MPAAHKNSPTLAAKVFSSAALGYAWIALVALLTPVASCKSTSVVADETKARLDIWPQGKSAADADGDRISDPYEEQLARQFRPIFHTNAASGYPPASLAVFLRNSTLLIRGGQTAGPADVPALLAQLSGKDSSQFKLQLRPRFDPEHSEAEAAKEKPTIFYRVFRPDPKTFVFRPEDTCEYVAVQYYYFCFFNDADFPANGGDHDGDWGCIDLTLIVKAPTGHPAAAASYDKPIPHSAVFHNHGRQLYANALPHQKLSFEVGRLQVYLEGGSNEPWPNAGGSGFGGWPAQPGFLANRRFQKSTGIDLPWSPREDRIARPHSGAGPAIAEYELLQLGERDHPGRHELCRFVMQYAGAYGEYAPSPADIVPILKDLGVPDNGPPPGPPFQPKMWDRQFEGAAGGFEGDAGWLEWKGGDAPEKAKEQPK